jgi:hypothetical protein
MADKRDARIEQEVLALVQESERTLEFLFDHVRTIMFDVDLAGLGRVVFHLVDTNRLEPLLKVCSRSEDRHALLYLRGWSKFPDTVEDGDTTFKVTSKDFEVVFRPRDPDAPESQT